VPREIGTLVQECGVGLVTLRDTGSRLAFKAPPLMRSGPVDDATLATVAAGLGLPDGALVAAQWVDNGPGWLGLLLDSADTVLALRPDLIALGTFEVGVIGPYAAADVARVGAADEVRAICPGLGLGEDPVTGSLNAGLAQWLIGSGRAPTAYVASQGTVLGRRGRVRVTTDGDDVWVGGDAVTCVVGQVAL
jgi:PhzF family phenazine biosynthesis protein